MADSLVGEFLMLAFTSCRRFAGQFYLRKDSLQVVVDAEGLELKPGESWELEEFTFRSGPDRAKLLEELAVALNTNHPKNWRRNSNRRRQAGVRGIVSRRESRRSRRATTRTS
ncbi:MAG: hypothetical protein J2P21_26105 [Chloracidobacterium sp.]|nr:hypothetical protein [Chloracidobacterium sp.]